MSWKLNPFTGEFDYYSSSNDFTDAYKGYVDAAYAHITASGSSHSYIDQDVTTTGSPTFVNPIVQSINLDTGTDANEGVLYFNSGTTLFIKAVDEE